MKKVLLTLINTLFIFFLPAQEIKFTIKNGEITNDGKLEKKYSLPLVFQFDKKFEGKKIIFKNSPDKMPIAFLDAPKFGSNNLSLDGNTGFFLVTIQPDRTLKNKIDEKINFDEFFLAIDNKDFGPFIIKGEVKDKSEADLLENYKPGMIYYDAIMLYQLKEKNDPAAILSVLEAYGIDRASCQNTPFLRETLGEIVRGQVPQGGEKFSLSNVFSAAGNLNVTNFADGLAKFLVERSKEELNVAFFRNFQEWLKPYPEAKILFPTTTGIIKNIASYNYAAMLPALRSCFHRDLNALTSNLLNLRETSNYAGYSTDNEIKNRADVISGFLNNQLPGRSVSAALVATGGVLKGINAADIINSITNDKSCSADDNFSNVFLFVDLISGSLRSKDEGRVWITKKQVADLVAKEDAIRIFMGLIYVTNQKNQRHGHSIQFDLRGNKYALSDFLKDVDDKWSAADEFISNFKELAMQASEIADNVKALFDTKNQLDETTVLQYAEYATSITRFLNLSVNFLPANDAIHTAITDLKTTVADFSSVIENAMNASYDIKSKNYTSLVLHLSELMNALPKKPKKDFMDEYIKYASFMAAVVEAQSSDEVKAAIEAIVLPVGSSSVKRETEKNISLNAFIGPMAGAEYFPKLKDSSTAFVTGLTAPVGVAFSWGKLHRGTKEGSGGKSFTIFIPLIDIGALATFRLGDDNTKVAAEIKLKNIISPGLYFYYGFGKCPISLGVGTQLGPELREVTTQKVDVNKNYYIRFGLNLVVDIPLLNLYTKN